MSVLAIPSLSKCLHPKHLCMAPQRTSDLCAMQQDIDNLTEARRTSLDARKIITDVCNTTVNRHGKFGGAGTGGILQKIEQDSKETSLEKDSGCNGWCLKEAVNELLGLEDSKHVVIEHTKDGPGIGAVLLAAVTSKYANEIQIRWQMSSQQQ